MQIKNTTLRIGKIQIDTYIQMTTLCIVTTLINSLVVKFPLVSALVAILEILFLVYILIFRSISKFTIVVIVLLSLSIENVGFALGDRNAILYSIYNLPKLRSYFLLFIMLLSIVKVFVVGNFKPDKYSGNNKYGNFYLVNAVCIISAAFMPIITVIINDNYLLVHRDMWRYIARDMYEIVYVFSILTLTTYCLKNDEKFRERIKSVLLGILAGVTWGAIILILCGNYYNAWGNEKCITCPLILFFAPGLILFSFEEYGWFNFMTGCIAFAMQLKYTVGIAGTWWAFTLIIGICFLRKLLEVYKEKRSVLFQIICWSLILVGGIFIVMSGFTPVMRGHITYKLSAFMRLFEVNTSISEWYAGLGGSIQARWEEIVNTVIELYKKPWAILFGKGYGGTVLKHWGFSDWNVAGSTFADEQIAYQTYSSFHISLAEIIINFGLNGIVLIFMVVKNCVSEFFKREGNMWIILGGVWFMFFYSLYYSFNIGLVWISYGLFLKSAQPNRT